MKPRDDASFVRSILRDALTVCAVTAGIEDAVRSAGLDLSRDTDLYVTLKAAEFWPPQKWAALFVAQGRNPPTGELRSLVMSGIRQRGAIRKELANG